MKYVGLLRRIRFVLKLAHEIIFLQKSFLFLFLYLTITLLIILYNNTSLFYHTNVVLNIVYI